MQSIRSHLTISCCTGGQVLSPQHAGRKGEGFGKAPVIAEVSLLPPGPNQAVTGAPLAPHLNPSMLGTGN